MNEQAMNEIENSVSGECADNQPEVLLESRHRHHQKYTRNHELDC